MSTINTLALLRAKKIDEKLTLDELACALYEGTHHVQNLAEKCARNYGKAGALPYYDMTSEDVRNFWRSIAQQIMAHSMQWEDNQGSGCVLAEVERRRLAELPRYGRDQGMTGDMGPKEMTE
jgi:hypothetical protein